MGASVAEDFRFHILDTVNNFPPLEPHFSLANDRPEKYIEGFFRLRKEKLRILWDQYIK